MVKTMARCTYSRSRLLFLIFSIFISSVVSAESVREFHERKCKEGDQDSCGRAADMREGEEHGERIAVLGDLFAAKIDRSVMEEDNKPLLGKAYPIVLKDYFDAEAKDGFKQAVTDNVINLCAEHFNHHWRDRKMWWPTDDAGKPDWSAIYFYIVDHYYGYCLRSML